MYLLQLALAVVFNEHVIAAPSLSKIIPTPLKESLKPIDPTDVGVETTNTNGRLYYENYLHEVIELLAKNANFKNILKNLNLDDIKTGRLSREINFVPRQIREKLNELKRQEVKRLRRIVATSSNSDQGRDIQSEIAKHLDSNNPDSFEAADLASLIKAVVWDLKKSDSERHEDFKKLEMDKALRREEKLQMLDEVEREKAKREYLRDRRKLAENKSLHHPGSKAQLEEVWNVEDGLSEQEFDPKTFFILHDQNSDGFIDSMELEALFEKDLGDATEESEILYLEEERRRMREHVMKEADKNSDVLISLQEFLDFTSTDEFANPDEDSYKTIDQLLMEHSLYTREELEKYKTKIAKLEAEIEEKLQILNEEVKNLGGLTKKLNEERNREKSEKDVLLQMREAGMEEQQENLQAIDLDVRKRNEEVLRMKKELEKHAVAEKRANEIKTTLENLPPGADKERAVKQAHRELQGIKISQGAAIRKN